MWKVLHFFRKIEPKSLPEASRSSLWPSWGSFCPSWGSFGAFWGSCWVSWGSLCAPERASGESLGASKTLPNRSRRLSRRPPAPELDFGSVLAPFWGSCWLHFGTPRTSKNVVFVWRVCHFSKKRGVRKNTLKTETWLSRNGKRVKSESRKHRKRRKTRGEKHKQWREEPEQSTRRHHEANVARASRASRLRVWWVACSPCSRAARARRAFGSGTFREFLERCFSELSGSIPGKAAKTCCARSPGFWSWNVS